MKQQRVWLTVVLLAMAFASTLAIRAQEQNPLRPPRNAKLALVVFEDLQCPDCARAEPLLQDAARAYKIPIVRYDFPLPQHAWAKQAAILARWFDTRTPKQGEEFRQAVFASQAQIRNPEELRAFAEKFAASKKIKLPFAVDPQGRLAAAVEHDKRTGERIGIQHTPTIYVVSATKTGTPFVEVVNRQQLFELIDRMKAELR